MSLTTRNPEANFADIKPTLRRHNEGYVIATPDDDDSPPLALISNLYSKVNKDSSAPSSSSTSKSHLLGNDQNALAIENMYTKVNKSPHAPRKDLSSETDGHVGGAHYASVSEKKKVLVHKHFFVSLSFSLSLFVCVCMFAPPSLSSASQP